MLHGLELLHVRTITIKDQFPHLFVLIPVNWFIFLKIKVNRRYRLSSHNINDQTKNALQ